MCTFRRSIVLLLAASLPTAFAVVRDIIHDYPDYFTLLSNTPSGKDTFRCSGVLIHPDIVLTSAQCANGNISYARIGYVNDEMTSVNVTGIKSFTNNYQWSPNHINPVNDIAIVTLDTAMEGVAFPKIDNGHIQALHERQEYTVFGAGDLHENGATATFLHGDNVMLQNFQSCHATYKESEHRPVMLAKGRQLCAGHFDFEAGPCSVGDWGSPLLKIVEGKDTLVGLASFGSPGCGEHDPPYIYTSVSAHYQWITDIVCWYSSMPPSYCTFTTNFVFTTATAAPTQPLDLTNFFTLLSDTPNGRGTKRCGGSLVGPDVVLTSVSCAQAGITLARVGYESDERSVALRNITKVVEHPDSGGVYENYPNDVALIFLSEPIYTVSTVTINSVMAFPPDNSYALQYRQAGAVVDQAQTYRLKRDRGHIKNTTELHTVRQDGNSTTRLFRQCQLEYKELSASTQYFSELEEGLQFCATASSEPCDVGAWGSPVFAIQDENTILQVGIVSQGSCQSDLPHVYTRIAYYADWILNEVCAYSQDPPCEMNCNERRRGLLRAVLL